MAPIDAVHCVRCPCRAGHCDGRWTGTFTPGPATTPCNGTIQFYNTTMTQLNASLACQNLTACDGVLTYQYQAQATYTDRVCHNIKLCPVGSHQTAAATSLTNTQCLACQAGTIDDDSNPITACIACASMGLYVPPSSYGSCTNTSFECRAGTIDNDHSTSTPCEACTEAAYFVPPASSGDCTRQALQCASGTIDNDHSASTPCTACTLTGSYVPRSSFGLCNQTLFECSAGTTDADGSASTQCMPCCAGTYTPPDQAALVQCTTALPAPLTPTTIQPRPVCHVAMYLDPTFHLAPMARAARQL